MTDELRILTVRQPWAWALIYGGKTVENRTRNLAGGYRGPVLIHAALADDLDAWRGLARTSFGVYGRALDARESLLGGMILGVADLVDVHEATHHYEPVDGAPWIRECTEDLCCQPWGERLQHHLVFENPRALDEPIPYRGGLGLPRVKDLFLTGDWLAEYYYPPGHHCDVPYGCPPGEHEAPVAQLIPTWSAS